MASQFVSKHRGRLPRRTAETAELRVDDEGGGRQSPPTAVGGTVRGVIPRKSLKF